MGLPLVATSDAHYLTRDDAPAHDILLCINTGKTLDDPNRMKFETDQFHVRSPDEMYEAMPGHEEALATSVRIAELVEDNYKSLDLGKRQFPVVPAPRPARRPRTISASSASRGCATATARPRPTRRATGSSTSSASSTGWGSPRTS